MPVLKFVSRRILSLLTKDGREKLNWNKDTAQKKTIVKCSLVLKPLIGLNKEILQAKEFSQGCQNLLIRDFFIISRTQNFWNHSAHGCTKVTLCSRYMTSNILTACCNTDIYVIHSIYAFSLMKQFRVVQGSNLYCHSHICLERRKISCMLLCRGSLQKNDILILQ